MVDDSGIGSARELMTVTANQLRRLAEAADGQRGQLLEVGDIVNTPNDASMPSLTRVNGAPKLTSYFLVQTALVAPLRPVPTKVEMTFPGILKPIVLDTALYDAVFWGESAMEKFLTPYYVRFYDDAQLATLQAAIRNEKVIAIAHLYPTLWEEIDDDGQSRYQNLHPMWRELHHIHLLSADEASSFKPLVNWLDEQKKPNS